MILTSNCASCSFCNMKATPASFCIQNMGITFKKPTTRPGIMPPWFPNRHTHSGASFKQTPFKRQSASDKVICCLTFCQQTPFKDSLFHTKWFVTVAFCKQTPFKNNQFHTKRFVTATFCKQTSDLLLYFSWILAHRTVAFQIFAHRTVAFQIFAHRTVAFQIFAHRTVAFQIFAHRTVAFQIFAHRTVAFQIFAHRTVAFQIFAHRTVAFQIFAHRTVVPSLEHGHLSTGWMDEWANVCFHARHFHSLSHTHTHACRHAHTRTHARTHAHTHTHKHMQREEKKSCSSLVVGKCPHSYFKKEGKYCTSDCLYPFLCSARFTFLNSFIYPIWTHFCPYWWNQPLCLKHVPL